MAERANSTGADARPYPEASTTRRAMMGGMAAVPALALPAIAAAAPDMPEDERRLTELLARTRALAVRMHAAADVLTAAEEAACDARAANPFPVVTDEDERIFKHAVRPGHDWNPERLAFFDKPFLRCDSPHKLAAHEYALADLRKARMAELAPLVAATAEGHRPHEEAEAAAQASYRALCDQETAILVEAADIAASTLAGVATKAAILVHYAGEPDCKAQHPEERMHECILRDLLAVGGANV